MRRVLRSLDLSDCEIGDEGGQALARALTDTSRALTDLSLSSNHLGLPAISAFANMLQVGRRCAGGILLRL